MVNRMESRVEAAEDYRQVLLEGFLRNKRRNHRYSYRLLASKLGMDVGHVYRILNGKKHLPLKHVPKVVEHLRLEEEVALRLLDLVGEAQGESEPKVASR